MEKRMIDELMTGIKCIIEMYIINKKVQASVLLLTKK